MGKFTLDNLTDDLEREEQRVEEQESELEDSRQRLQNIENAIEALSGDSAVKAALSSNRQEAQTEEQAAQEKLERSKEIVLNLNEQIEAASQELSEEFDVLREFEAIGEDVSEAKAILEERRQLLEECHSRLESVAQRLGLSVGSLDMEMDGGVSGSSVSGGRAFDDSVFDDRVSDEELAYLNENDFGAATDQIFDYNDPRYLAEGILTVDRDLEMDGGVSGDSVSDDRMSDEELAYLNENDFGAVTAQVFDYNDLRYLANGILKVDWGKDAKDIPHDEVIPPGDVVARCGGENGTYFSDISTDFNSIQVPYYEGKYRRRYYKVLKPLPVTQSTVAWQKNFGISPGHENTQQYATAIGEKELVEQGYITEISPEEAFRLSPEGKTCITDRRRTLQHDLNNPDLFKENQQGDYHYHNTMRGKAAYGSLVLKKGKRDALQQKTVGEKNRAVDDDGGHFIGSRFLGAATAKNLEAQNRNLNRSSYKIMENKWQKHLEAGDKVFVTVESYKSNGSDRPDCFMGYYIVEHPDGKREYESFSFQNESAQTQTQWNEEIAAQES